MNNSSLYPQASLPGNGRPSCKSIESRFPTTTRREWLRSAIVGGVSASGWLRRVAAAAAGDPRRKTSVILLWLNGGPATIDMWDLKPGHDHGGPFREIATSVPGLRISEHLPKLAQWGHELAVVRSLTTREGDHARATHLVRTGYVPQGAIRFPALGAVLAHESRRAGTDLPDFVSIAAPERLNAIGAGFLGPELSPLAIPRDGGGGFGVPNLKRPAGVTEETYADRLALLRHLEHDFAAGATSAVADSQRAATNRADRLMRPDAAAAFRLDVESDAVRGAYGRGPFGQGCLLARRLVERGVPFVEVSLDGWDTHQNNFAQVAELSSTLDTAMSALLRDLHDRRLLATTLVLCQGEFGRTPRINLNSGRDHWPHAWSAVLAGGGICGGQAVGRTSDDGTSVADRPVTVPDLIATVCRAIGIDPRKQNVSNVGRPIRLADPAAQAVEELL